MIINTLLILAFTIVIPLNAGKDGPSPKDYINGDDLVRAAATIYEMDERERYPQPVYRPYQEGSALSDDYFKAMDAFASVCESDNQSNASDLFLSASMVVSEYLTNHNNASKTRINTNLGKVFFEDFLNEGMRLRDHKELDRKCSGEIYRFSKFGICHGNREFIKPADLSNQKWQECYLRAMEVYYDIFSKYPNLPPRSLSTLAYTTIKYRMSPYFGELFSLDRIHDSISRLFLESYDDIDRVTRKSDEDASESMVRATNRLIETQMK